MAVASPISPVYTIIEFNSGKHEVKNFMDTTPQAETLNNTVLAPRAGLTKPKVGALFSQMNFTMEAAGSGTAGTAPSNGVLLIACGFEQTIGAGTSVTYSTYESQTILGVTAQDIDKFLGDEIQYACNSARGNLEMRLVAGEKLDYVFNFQGTYEAPADASSAGTFATTARPVVAKGLTVTVGAQTLVLKECIINLNNNIVSPRKNLAATNGVAVPVITSQMPTMTITAELAFDTFNPYAIFAAETKTALSAVLGGSAGNITTITGDWYPLGFPTENDDGEIVTFTQTFQMSNIAGDTQLTIVYT